MHHPEKAVLDATAGTGNTATRILMKDGLYVMGTNAKLGAKKYAGESWRIIRIMILVNPNLLGRPVLL
jgi:hypothetical protein